MRSPEAMVLARAVLAGEVRALARAITLVENDAPTAGALSSALFPHTGRAAVIGVTGAPGAGKSTLVDALIARMRADGERVGVLAVDPSSPLSGGALLGDRIRMQAWAQDSGVFIRSMSARAQLGGLARATRKAVHLLDAAGFTSVLVETVGVGQSEIDIAGSADTVVLVVTPDMGDTVQTMKAGILELADIFALNKADQQGAGTILRALRALAHDRPAGWPVPVVATVATTGNGADEVWQAIRAHQRYLHGSGDIDVRRQRRLRGEVLAALERALRSSALDTESMESQLHEVYGRRQDPDGAAATILQRL